MYFAAQDSKECASVLNRRSQSFFNFLKQNFFLDKLYNQWRAYHGAFGATVTSSDHTVQFVGEQGELVKCPVNHYRNLASHILTMITSNRPSMQARAINTDYKSLSQAYLANGILDYYMRDRGLEDILKQATETAIVLGAGYIEMEWNATAGENYDVDPESGEMIKEGDIIFSVRSPLDVVVDGTKESWNNEWIVVREYVNRYNLIAKYPEFEENIKALPTKDKETCSRLAVFSNDETDDVAVFKFYHKRTEAVPTGRYMLYLGDSTVLFDSELPYREIPVYRIAPATFLGTPYGYSPMFDVYPLQEAINAMFSTVITNNNAFGVQNLWVKKGSDIDIAELSGGLNVIQSDEKPEILQLTGSSPETYQLIDLLVKSSEIISGVNSVARGNPESSLKSGAALAMIQSMALQFISGLQQSYVKTVENVGTGLINILKDYANTPKVIAIVGKGSRTYLKEFTGESISAINRVVVDISNPLAKTTAGRVQMAEQLLQMKLLTAPEQYFQIIETGKLETAFEGKMKELLLIDSENEKLLEGAEIMAIMADDHRLHISEHKGVLADPDLRANPQLMQQVLGHIQEHIMYLQNTPPETLVLLGQQPLPPPSNVPQQAPGGAPMMEPPQGDLTTPEFPQLPSIPTPPAPFDGNPVLAQDLSQPMA